MYREVFPNYGNEYNKCRHRHHEAEESLFFIRGTTPPFEFTLYDDEGEADLSELTALEAYVSQDREDGENIVVTKTMSDMTIDGGTVSFYLTQEETLRFESGDEPFPKFAFVQLRGLTADGVAWATLAERKVKVYRIGKEAVIE